MFRGLGRCECGGGGTSVQPISPTATQCPGPGPALLHPPAVVFHLLRAFTHTFPSDGVSLAGLAGPSARRGTFSRRFPLRSPFLPCFSLRSAPIRPGSALLKVVHSFSCPLWSAAPEVGDAMVTFSLPCARRGTLLCWHHARPLTHPHPPVRKAPRKQAHWIPTSQTETPGLRERESLLRGGGWLALRPGSVDSCDMGL